MPGLRIQLSDKVCTSHAEVQSLAPQKNSKTLPENKTKLTTKNFFSMQKKRKRKGIIHSELGRIANNTKLHYTGNWEIAFNFVPEASTLLTLPYWSWFNSLFPKITKIMISSISKLLLVWQIEVRGTLPLSYILVLFNFYFWDKTPIAAKAFPKLLSLTSNLRPSCVSLPIHELRGL